MCVVDIFNDRLPLSTVAPPAENNSVSSSISLAQQAEQQAREAADVAAKNLSKAAWGTLITLLISGALSFAIGRFALTSRNRRIATLR
ncbi:hypothetical protein [Pseudomonas sp. 1121_17]|uniref:hypothetical protein n=1 Tax=Pseudomonas sp. 1121_17 TaxID=2604458 RepID=UPI00406285E7